MKSIVVNLKRRPDRKNDILNLFKEHNIKDYEFFEAIDGQNLKGTREIYNLFLGNDFNWRRGVIGCALSHYILWKKLIEDNVEHYCIFEDDIQFIKNFNILLDESKRFISHNKNVDILYLGYHMFNQIRKNMSSIYDIESENVSFSPYRDDLYIGGTFSYIISKTGAKKMLDYIEKNNIKHGIDYVMKINKGLIVYECQPLIVKSDWVDSMTSKVDSDIQKDIDCLTFENAKTIVNIEGEKYEFYQGLDAKGHDMTFLGKKSVKELSNIVKTDPLCKGFNTLGFLKLEIEKVIPSPWLHPINDGLYVKIPKKIRVKMICDWCSSQQLCLEWNHMSKGNFSWNNIEIVSNDENIDYYVIINKSVRGEFYIPEKTIIFHMEPWCYSPSQNWGVKTWGQWARPDENKFLQVRNHEKYLNNTFWQLKTTYNEFKTVSIVKNKKYGDIISTICSSKYFDPGHIKRIDFIKFIEAKNDPSVQIHIYNHDNTHNFKNYQGPHPPGNKDVGILPYKYYFMGENNAEKNFITEKIWEPLLTESLCFYWGCPNISDYINPDAFVILDLDDFEKSFQTIKYTIENNLWEKRLDIIRAEKKKVLDYYNFFPTLERIIEYKNYLPFLKGNYENVCFIHSCNLLNVGTQILDDIVKEIYNSDLINELDVIIINNIGIPLEKKYGEKIRIINYSTNSQLFELPTIKLISLFSENNPDCKVLYLHTKGITQNNQNVVDWRKYMEYFLISRYKECFEALNKYDAIGCNFSETPYKHFSGNFWWANSNYIRKISTEDLKVRHDAEWWILKSTNNFLSLHDSNIDHYKTPYPLINYVVKKKIGFLVQHLSERGTTTALYDYAYHNEKILGNESIVFYNKGNPENFKEYEEKFNREFKCFSYENFSEIDEIIKNEKISHLYMIKYGLNDGILVKNCQNLIHSVFVSQPHGEKYAFVSRYLSEKYGNEHPYVPHMIDLPNIRENLRNVYNIPKDAIVFGSFGGKTSFDISFVHNSINKIIEEKKNIYFLFMNFEENTKKHERIIYLPPTIDKEFKVKFINSCDAMIHARSIGETFGLAIGEFSSCNKPIITYFDKEKNLPLDKEHIRILGDKGIYYKNEEELLEIFRDFKFENRDWNCYKEYNPENVMNVFETVFLSDEKNFKIVNIKGINYKYYPGLDSTGYDRKFVSRLNIEELSEIAEKENCPAFNTLGFIKYKTQPLTTSPWIDKNNGIYIKIN